MPRKKRGRRGGSTVKKMLGIWLVEAMRWNYRKVKQLLLVGCSDWGVILGSNCIELCLRKVDTDVRVIKTGTWQPGSPHGSRMGYLPWLMSCWLMFRRLPWVTCRVWREHLISKVSWVQNYMTISQTWLPCPPSRWVSPCDLWLG